MKEMPEITTFFLFSEKNTRISSAILSQVITKDTVIQCERERACQTGQALF